MDDQPKPINDHGYFKCHNCVIPADKLTAYNVKLKGWRKTVFDFICVDHDDIRAMHLYKSFAAFSAQKYKHYNESFWMIHPYSKLRFWYELLFAVTNVIFPIPLAIHAARRGIKSICPFFIMKQICHITYILQVIINFFTGYIVGGYRKQSIMELKKTSWHYLKTWFLVDVVTAIGIISFFISVAEPHYSYLDIAKMMQLPKLYIYTQNLMTVLHWSPEVKIIIEIAIATVLYLSWNIYFQFAVECIVETDCKPSNPRNCSWLSMGKLWNETATVKSLYALDRSVIMFTSNTNVNIVRQPTCFGNFLLVGWLISKILLYHYTLKYIMVRIGTESARSNYHIMKTQIETYMAQRNFPPRIKKKMLNFYAIRFHRTYMAESSILNCLSGQIRDDILMHTSRQLVKELPVLQNLPQHLLMEIAFKLRLVIFLAGDIIYKINTPGDYLFFVDKGTVAIYSDSGKELGHVEDGDFFGEVALVLTPKFRVVSAIAVTNCELYRLSKEDFDITIAYHSTLFDYFKRTAIQRFEQICVFDAMHKAELKWKQDINPIE